MAGQLTPLFSACFALRLSARPPPLVYNFVRSQKNHSGILYFPTRPFQFQHHSQCFALLTLVVPADSPLADGSAPEILAHHTPMMPSSKSTILFLAALAVVGPVAMSQPANALQAMGPPPVRRAEHIQLAHKMIKKRSAFPRVVPIRRQDTPEVPPGPAATTSLPPSGINTPDPVSSDTSVATSRTPDPTTRPTTTTQPRPTVRISILRST
jgi:hypothetical protein